MGGDYAPENPVAGAINAAREFGIHAILVGDEQKINAELANYDVSGLPLEIVHTSEYISMEETTLDAMRSKRDSSIRVAARLVKEGKANGLVSAGHTGATMAITKIIAGSLNGVKRPALALAVPNPTGKPSVFLDVGANVTCTTENLVQFAIMGSTYATDILHYDNPRVGVLSNGEEATKGNELVRDAVEWLSKADLNFIGHVEGKDLFNGECDVIVTDGFTGNAVLKAAESIAELTFKVLKREVMNSWISKLGALFMRRSFKRLKKKFDYAEYGGAPLLGVKGVAIICHGRSNPEAIKNAIRVAAEFYENEANSHIQRGISDLYKKHIM